MIKTVQIYKKNNLWKDRFHISVEYGHIVFTRSPNNQLKVLFYAICVNSLFLVITQKVK